MVIPRRSLCLCASVRKIFRLFLSNWHGICYVIIVGGSNQNPVAVMGCQPRVALKAPGPGLEEKTVELKRGEKHESTIILQAQGS